MAIKKGGESRTSSISQFLADSIEAGLSHDIQRLEMIALTASRALKKDEPSTARKISTILSHFETNAGSLRWANSMPPPTDADEGNDLVYFPSVEDAVAPVFEESVRSVFDSFFKERQSMGVLAEYGFKPPRTILCQGPPGTGKTMSASWIAKELNLPLVVLDLASSISSFLGKTGSNLRRSLDYARSHPCVFLLDEFDSIAKRRDDDSEVGELKRIVNVLLKELESWPLHTVLFAATNHEKMLDPAIQRRFDVIVDIPLPDTKQRARVLENSLSQLAEKIPKCLINAVAEILKNSNCSEIERIGQAAARQHLVSGITIIEALLDRLGQADNSNYDVGNLIRAIRKDSNFTVREIGVLVGKSPTSVQYHLDKEKKSNARKSTKTTARKR